MTRRDRASPDRSSTGKEPLIPVDAPIRRDVTPHKSRLIDAGGAMAPAAPDGLDDVGVPVEFLSDLVLKIAHLSPHFTTDWIAQRTHLTRSIVADLLEQLMLDRLIEVVGQDGPLAYRWAVTDRGRQRAVRLIEICGYTGPAPVSVETYTANVEWQCDHLPDVPRTEIARVVSSMVLPPHSIEVASLAALSRRSLFLYGPPGNGKTTLGRLLHSVMRGELWIPHAIAVGNEVVRIFDPHVHTVEPLPADSEDLGRVDQRWVRIRRPFVIAAGELELDDLDLAYSPALRYYEAPLHVKANGGLFMLDDFGYQRANPFQMLNRWIFPLEHRVDFLTLKTGQKLFLPFRLMLVIATNLDPEAVMEPAILRRMGYRLYLGEPSPEQYREIFERLAAHHHLEVPFGLIDHLLARHQREDRPLRACEPHDLLERVRDISRLRGHPRTLNTDIIDLAWTGYYGSDPAPHDEPGWT